MSVPGCQPAESIRFCLTYVNGNIGLNEDKALFTWGISVEDPRMKMKPKERHPRHKPLGKWFHICLWRSNWYSESLESSWIIVQEPLQLWWIPGTNRTNNRLRTQDRGIWLRKLRNSKETPDISVTKNTPLIWFYDLPVIITRAKVKGL